jgi:hypothetical protein
MTDPAEEQISRSEEDHGFGDVEALLVIADQPVCISSRLAFPTTSALRFLLPGQKRMVTRR